MLTDSLFQLIPRQHSQWLLPSPSRTSRSVSILLFFYVVYGYDINKRRPTRSLRRVTPSSSSSSSSSSFSPSSSASSSSLSARTNQRIYFHRNWHWNLALPSWEPWKRHFMLPSLVKTVGKRRSAPLAGVTLPMKKTSDSNRNIRTLVTSHGCGSFTSFDSCTDSKVSLLR